MDELDQLLADLQSTCAPEPVADTPVATSTADDDLNSLLNDLESFKTAPAPKAAKAPPKAAPKKNKTTSEAMSNVDDLLASLMAPADAPKPKKKDVMTPSLDDALGDIDDVLNDLGSMTVEEKKPKLEQSGIDGLLEDLTDEIGFETSRKSCARCSKPVVGQDVTALGKDWHAKCFSCMTCRVQLNTHSFFDHQGVPYCQKDYQALFAARCAYCNGVIEDDCITALGRTWHLDHFFCSQCGRTFEDGKYMEMDGKAYCDEDYFNMFAPKCGGCAKPVMDDMITAMNQEWHENCFACMTCKKGFGNAAFYEYENKPYCHQHWCEAKGMLCQSCQKPITGKFVTASGNRRYHVEHFVCAFCRKQLSQVASRERENKFYCQPCHLRIYE